MRNILSLLQEQEDLKIKMAKAIALTELMLTVDLQEHSALNLHLNLELLNDLLKCIENNFDCILKFPVTFP